MRSPWFVALLSVSVSACALIQKPQGNETFSQANPGLAAGVAFSEAAIKSIGQPDAHARDHGHCIIQKPGEVGGEPCPSVLLQFVEPSGKVDLIRTDLDGKFRLPSVPSVVPKEQLRVLIQSSEFKVLRTDFVGGDKGQPGMFWIYLGREGESAVRGSVDL